MRKILTVFRREYLQAVRKKSFIIMTFAMPFLMALVMAVPAILMKKGFTERHVLVIDGTGRLASDFSANPPDETTNTLPENQITAPANRQARQAGRMTIDYVPAVAGVQQVAAPRIKELSAGNTRTGVDTLLVIPADAVTNPKSTLVYYSRSAADLFAQERITRMANTAVQRARLMDRGVHSGDIQSILTDLTVDSVQISKSGEQKRGGEGNLAVGFVFAALLVVPVFIYGIEIMRGIVQEKTDRVVEVLISSMSATELLTGKIAGLAAVGLTQLGAWVLMANLLAAYGVVASYMAGMNILQFLRPAVFLYFGLFFLLGYLLFVCMYAIGGAASSTEKDAQQLLGPMIMFMMLPWFLMVPIITNPDSQIAVWLSLIPLFAPITMFVRVLISEPPLWQVVTSVILTSGLIFLLLKAAAKIFRIGILMYGKRATIPEIVRWLKQA